MRDAARRGKANHDAAFLRARASPAHSFLHRRPFGFLLCLIAFGGVIWAPHAVRASSAAVEGAGLPLDLTLLAGIALILIVAQLCGALFERFHQPAVLGELLGGVILGNLTLVGITAVEPLRANEVTGALAQLGVIVLMFEVGLESSLGGMLAVGWSALLVAMAGVVAPFFLGWGAAAFFAPREGRLGHIFIGATLCATSVGITARVLKDLGRLATREARIILGAAVIDDVLGLLILAVIAGAIKAAETGAELSPTYVLMVAAKAIVFLVGVVVIGRFIAPHLLRGVGRFGNRGLLLAISYCFLLAWAAGRVGLAPIVGAFAAGLVLDESHFEKADERKELNLEQMLAPIGALLIPIFFVLMGMSIDLRVFARGEVLSFAMILTLAAIAGKQLCALAVVERRINRLAIGLGMIPRGEVGLIFAGIGATLTLPDAQGLKQPVISAGVFGAVVVVVIVTTLLTPPVLKWSLGRTPVKSEAPRATGEIADEITHRIAR